MFSKTLILGLTGAIAMFATFEGAARAGDRGREDWRRRSRYQDSRQGGGADTIAQCYVLNNNASSSTTTTEPQTPPAGPTSVNEPVTSGPSGVTVAPGGSTATTTAPSTTASTPTTATAGVTPTTTGVATPAPVASTSQTSGVATPSGASGDSTPSGYSVVLRLEPNNTGEISADTYLLTAGGRTIKQVGHAEVGNGGGASGSSGSSGASGMEFSAASDSPFPFDLLVSNQTDDRGRFQATLNTDNLFSGEALSGLEMICRLE